MLKPVSENSDSPITPKRRRRLKTIAMLPTLLTLGSLYFGFAATYFCGKEMQDLGAGIQATEVRTLNSDFMEARAPSYLAIAAWMVVAAMICDTLDGRVARKTGQASKFGEQLDSLADMVSFGIAPALMMVTLIQRQLVQWDYPPFGFEQFGQVAVLIGTVYVCCTALRLARFTVETSLEEADHKGFRGLPSPGAAGAVVSLIYLHDHLDMPNGWPGIAYILAILLPVGTLLLALLMVSRVPYRHAVSSFLRRRPFGHLIPILLGIPFLLIFTEQGLAFIAWAYIASGIAKKFWPKPATVPQPETELKENQESINQPTKKQVQ